MSRTAAASDAVATRMCIRPSCRSDLHGHAHAYAAEPVPPGAHQGPPERAQRRGAVADGVERLRLPRAVRPDGHEGDPTPSGRPRDHQTVAPGADRRRVFLALDVEPCPEVLAAVAMAQHV